MAGAFLRDIASAIDAVPEAVGRSGYAVYAPQGSEAVLRPLLPAHFGFLCRHDATLSGVLPSATEHFLAHGHDCVVLVNADSLTLPTVLITAAVAALRAAGDSVVLGPATDGGYYLIGLKRPHTHLFEGIPWSTAGVLSATVARAAEIGLPVKELPLWYDIDDATTYAWLGDELSGRALPFAASGLRGGPALATRAFLDRARPTTAADTVTGRTAKA